jgi:hypothetical protein
MNIFYKIIITINFIIIIIKVINYLLKNNGNQNKKNVVVKEYNFLQKSEEEKVKVKEFAKHHFNELKKINPLINLEDDFPENVFPKELKKLLLSDINSEKDYIEAINSINNNFTSSQIKDKDYYSNRPVTIIGNDIFINNDIIKLRYNDIEIIRILKLEKDVPEINIFEDGIKIKTFVIEPKNNNPNLKGQHFHSYIRINSNSSVQIDGYISKNPNTVEANDEGIRLQPFFLSDKEEENIKMRGKGMFERGLHYKGYISNGRIRLICICDDCQKSFSVGFYHAGFSEVQYFYSSNSKETLLVPYSNNLGEVPCQLQKDFDESKLKELESKLPRTEDGKFEYYNSFKCPHCNYDYINFRENKESRPYEYYVNYHINQETRSV